MRIEEVLRKKFPIDEAIEDLKRLTDDPSQLGDFMKNEEIPVFILTFNHSRNDIPPADTFKNICKVIFVCSTDDPYLETFRNEIKAGEEILVFDKAEYVGDITRNGDDFGLTPPYNQCGCFARRFIDDYTQKMGIKRYIVTDNDLKFGIRKYDGKRYPMTDDVLLAAVKTYFYILDKYTDHFPFLNCATPRGEFGGLIYKNGFSVGNLMVYFHNKPVRWISRFRDDILTIQTLLRDTGKLAISFPYIRAEFLSKEQHGDMERAYNELKKNKIDPFFDYSKFFLGNLDGVKHTYTRPIRYFAEQLPDYQH